MSLQPLTLFSFNISACGFLLVGLKNDNNNNNNMNETLRQSVVTDDLQEIVAVSLHDCSNSGQISRIIVL